MRPYSSPRFSLSPDPAPSHLSEGPDPTGRSARWSEARERKRTLRAESRVLGDAKNFVLSSPRLGQSRRCLARAARVTWAMETSRPTSRPGRVSRARDAPSSQVAGASCGRARVRPRSGAANRRDVSAPPSPTRSVPPTGLPSRTATRGRGQRKRFTDYLTSAPHFEVVLRCLTVGRERRDV